MIKIDTIDKITLKTREQFLSEHILFEKPVIITGIANHWRAIQHWTADYLSQTIGQVDVTYRLSASYLHPDLNQLNPSSFYTPHAKKISNEMANLNYFHSSKLHEFICLITDKQLQGTAFLCGEGLSIYNHNKFNDKIKAILPDFDLPFLFDEKNLIKAGLWVSPKKIVSWLHYDGNGLHNLNAQVRGQKKVRLFSPQETWRYYIYLYSKSPYFNFSQINILNPNLSKFPHFENACYYEGILEEGDLLYIPAYWLHTFEHLDDININLNFWWKENLKIANPLLIRSNFFSLLKTLLTRQDKTDLSLPINALLKKYPPAFKKHILDIETAMLETSES